MLYRKYVLIISTCFVVSCFASQESTVDQPEMKLMSVDSCIEGDRVLVKQSPTNCGYNTPVLLNACAWTGLQVTGSFIYWKASANYLISGFLNTLPSTNPVDPEDEIFQGSVLEPDFKYKPGYKIGLSYTFKEDSWNLFAEYTAFHQCVSTFKQVDAVNGSIVAEWLTFLNVGLLQEDFSSISSLWSTKLDILDAEIGRNFFCGQYLTFRPSLGLRNLWLKQNYDLNYTSLNNAIPVDSFNSSNSWGIGPKFSLNGSWYLCWGLKVVGDIGVSLLYFQDNISAKQHNPRLQQILPGNDIVYKNREFVETVKPILDLSLGLGWDKTFCSEKCFLSLFVGYDFSNYWDQGSIQLGTAPLVAPGVAAQFIIGGANRNSGNLSIQGLRATAKLNF